MNRIFYLLYVLWSRKKFFIVFRGFRIFTIFEKSISIFAFSRYTNKIIFETNELETVKEIILKSKDLTIRLMRLD